MQPTNQNTQPDFGFILNQQAPVPEKKKLDKKVVLIFACLILLAVLGAVNFFLSANKKVATNSTEQGTGPVTLTTDEKAYAQPVADYFTLISNNKAAEAYDLFSSDLQKQVTKDQFVKFANTSVGANLALPLCTIQGKPQVSNGSSKIVFTCPTKDNGTILTFENTVIKINNQYKISEFSIKAAANAKS